MHRGEPVFDPEGYWRGSAWPQLTYLLTLAGVPLGGRLVRGREAVRPAPSTGTRTRAKGLGAMPAVVGRAAPSLVSTR